MVIRIKNLRLRAIIGTNEWERRQAQEIVLNIELEYDATTAAASDSIAQAVDYKQLKLAIMREVETSQYFLLEKLAAQHAGDRRRRTQGPACRRRDRQALRPSLCQLGLGPLRLHEASVNRAVIAIGSNIHPRKNLALALAELAAHHTLLAKSRFVRTKPVGGARGANFLNGAVLIETNLDRRALRAWLRGLESQLGRARSPDKNAPRTIDLDIVIWNGRIVHEDVRTRPFVAKAVQEVLPELKVKPCPLEESTNCTNGNE